MVRPEEVRSPRLSWRLIRVLFDGGPGADSLAVGDWEGERVLAARWNGEGARGIGNPQSRGLPTWFIIPGRYNRAILDSFSERDLPPSRKQVAEDLLGM